METTQVSTPPAVDTWFARAIARRTAEENGTATPTGARFNSAISR